MQLLICPSWQWGLEACILTDSVCFPVNVGKIHIWLAIINNFNEKNLEAFHQFFNSVERFSLLNVDALISHFYLSHQESRQSWNRKVENNSSQFLLTILKTIWNSKDEIIHKTWKLKRKKTLYISYAHSQYVKMLQNQNRNWIRIDKKKICKSIPWNCHSPWPKNHARFVFTTKIFIKKWALKKPQNLRKMLRKSPASNACVTVFKKADFPRGL